MSFGTGEAGIYTVSKEEYYEDCLPDVIAGIFCTYYGVPEPSFKRNPTPANGVVFHGTYYPKKELISHNRDYLGLIMHELAHHINHKLHTDGSMHDSSFKRILQEMHDYWR